jgi:hypothetical protein
MLTKSGLVVTVDLATYTLTISRDGAQRTETWSTFAALMTRIELLAR